jgi:hypothetical protein
MTAKRNRPEAYEILKQNKKYCRLRRRKGQFLHADDGFRLLSEIVSVAWVGSTQTM